MVKKKILSVTFFILVLYILPITLLWIEIIPFKYRYDLLYIMSFIIGCYVILSKYSLHELAMSVDSFKSTYKPYIIVTISILLVLFFFTSLKIFSPPKQLEWKFFYTFYVFISSPLQEFCCRSVFFARLHKAGLNNKWIQILLSASVYSYMHVPWKDFSTIIVTFFMGLIWGYLFFKKPNYYMVTLSHTVLGLSSILLGIVK